MKNKRVIRAFVIPAILLIVPILGSLTVEGWNWGWNDYLFAYVIWTVFGQTYVFLTKNTSDKNKKIAIGFSVFSVLAIIWVVLATG